MVCQVCLAVSGGTLCDRCRAGLRPAPERVLAGSVRLVSAFEHSGPARTLIHHLKYRGVLEYADFVAQILAPRMPRLPLVPIPRVWSRYLRYGVDPARELARRISRMQDLPVWDVFNRPLHHPRRAGGDHGQVPMRLTLKVRPTTPVIVVDDVVTSGATLDRAIDSIGRAWVSLAVAANAATTVSTLGSARHAPHEDSSNIASRRR